MPAGEVDSTGRTCSLVRPTAAQQHSASSSEVPLIWLQVPEPSQVVPQPACSTTCTDRLPNTSTPCGTGCCSASSRCTAGAALQQDPDLVGRVVLLVLTGSRGRTRVLRSLVTSGARIVVYAPEINWASQFIPAQDWVLGPTDNLTAAHAAVLAWEQAQACEHAPSTQAHQPQVVLTPPTTAATAYPCCCSSSTPASAPPCSCAGTHAAASGCVPKARVRQTSIIEAVLCYDEYGVQMAAGLAEALGLPGIPPCVMETIRSKRWFREACRAGGVPAPGFMHVSESMGATDAEVEAKLAQRGLRFPVIVKPAGCGGSFSVFRAQTGGELRHAVDQFYANLPAYLATTGLSPQSSCATGGMVVEEMLQGHEVDVDCVVVGGQLLFASVSDNHPPSSVGCDMGAFVETGCRCPSNQPHAVQAELLKLANSVVQLFGSSLSGVLHFEAMYTARYGAVPIELNARIGGAETYTDMRTAWGIDLARTALRIALQLPVQLPQELVDASVKPASALAAVKAAGQAAFELQASAACTATFVVAMADDGQTGSGVRGAQLGGHSGHSSDQDDEVPLLPHGLMLARSSAGSSSMAVPAHQLLCTCSSGDLHDAASADSPPYGSPLTCYLHPSSHPLSSRQCQADAAEVKAAEEVPDTVPTKMAPLVVVRPHQYISSVNFVPQDWRGLGIVELLAIQEEGRQDKGFVDVDFYYQPGALVRLPPDGFSALGWMVAQASSHEGADAALDRLMDNVLVRLRKP